MPWGFVLWLCLTLGLHIWMGRTECLHFYYTQHSSQAVTHTLYIMQMHFLLAFHCFSESSLTKVNVFVSGRAGTGSVQLALFVSSSLGSCLSYQSRARFHSPFRPACRKKCPLPLIFENQSHVLLPMQSRTAAGCLEESLYQNFSAKTSHFFTQLSFLQQPSCCPLPKET